MKTASAPSTGKITRLLIISLLLVFGLAGRPWAAEKAQLEILYMNHGPMRPTLVRIRELLQDFPHAFEIHWYDFDTPAAGKFMKRRRLSGHIPLLILLNGRSDFDVNGRRVQLRGFPTGAAPFKKVEGNWSFGDLRLIFEQNTAPAGGR